MGFAARLSGTEDRGIKSNCQLTAWLLSNTSRRVFLLHPTQPPIRIRSANELSRYKKSVKIGYNLVAIPGP